MLAVIMLAWYEICQLRRMVTNANQPMGSVLDTPDGPLLLTAVSKAQHLELAARFSRCCRAIDDVLMIDLTRGEQTWLLDHTYPGALQLKAEHVSPDRIFYLDMEIRHDKGGFYTTMYDKRDELRLQGKMGAVRRFPHPSSVLSEQCKGACLTSFLHRAQRVCMRRKQFVRAAAERMVDMAADGYNPRKLSQLATQFANRYIAQPAARAFTVANLRRMVATVDAERRAANLLDTVKCEECTVERNECSATLPADCQTLMARWAHLVTCEAKAQSVYIGRNNEGVWGNRVSRPLRRTTAEHRLAVDRYWEWLLQDAAGRQCITAARGQLRGKVLRCHCPPPLPCHGHALAAVANCTEQQLNSLLATSDSRYTKVD